MTLFHFEARYDHVHQRAQKWGIGVLVLSLPEGLFPAVVSETRKHRNSQWYAYLNSLGDEEQVIHHFVNWQHRLESFYDNMSSEIAVYKLSIPSMSTTEFFRALAKALAGPDFKALSALGGKRLG